MHEPSIYYELEAVGTEPDQYWKLPLTPGELVCLGRAPRIGWTVGWDPMISREHVELILRDDRLTVTRLETAKNPVIFSSQERVQFELVAEQTFQIGNTIFRLLARTVGRSTVHEQAFDAREISSIRPGGGSPWHDLITELPKLISDSQSTEEFTAAILDRMLDVMPHAELVAVMHYDTIFDPSRKMPHMMQMRTRTDRTAFRPSRRLISTALESRKYILHVWTDASPSGDFTVTDSFDWAFCAPVTQRACSGWCIYAAGHLGVVEISRDQLLEDLRFTEIIAQFVGAILQVRLLEQRTDEMTKYFSPTIINTLRRLDQKELQRRETEVSILFCDLRGFSWRVEKHQHRLEDVFDRVSMALSVMTRNIIKMEGAIADFQGDAALAFWGWPQQLEEGPLAACRAALAMFSEFQQATDEPGHPLEGFQVGIGIGLGTAIAGRIGTQEQAKLGVFGSVVNRTSRLEGLTRPFRTPILVDEPTALFIRQSMSRHEARCRKVAVIRPQGMQQPMLISELLPPADAPQTISDSVLAAHELAVDAFITGRWSDAFDIFASLPAADRAKDYLVWFMAQHQFTPPQAWDGVLEMNSK
jgi:adenylate cyclase